MPRDLLATSTQGGRDLLATSTHGGRDLLAGGRGGRDLLAGGGRDLLASQDDDDENVVSRTVKDLGVSTAGGVNALLKISGDLYGLATGDMDNFASQQGQSGLDYWNAKKSEHLQDAEEYRRQKIDSYEGQVFKQAGVAFWETVSSPTLLSSFLAEQAPMLIPGAAAGRVAGAVTKSAGAAAATTATVATGVAVGAGAAMHGADVGSQAFDQLMELPDELWLANPDIQTEVDNGRPLEEVKHSMALMLSREAGIAAAVTSGALNLLPGARILEKSLGGVKLTGGRLSNVIKGFLGETLSEGLEEGTGALMSNLATSQIDPDQDILEGVGEATGMGAAAGPFGAIAGATNADSSTTDPDDIIADIASTTNIDDAIDAAADITNTDNITPAPFDVKIHPKTFYPGGVPFETDTRDIAPGEQRPIDQSLLDEGNLRILEKGEEAVAPAAPEGTIDFEPPAPIPPSAAPIEELQAKTSREQRLPENFQEPRLLRDQFRKGLEDYSSQLIKGGGITLTGGEFSPNADTKPVNELDPIKRTKSQNPEWFQDIATQESITVEQTQAAVKKALNGEKLGVREARVITGMLDTLSGERTDPANIEFIKAEIEKARVLRRDAAKDLPPLEAYARDIESAGELFSEPEYAPEWDGETRSLFELLEDAKDINREEAYTIYESGGSDIAVAGRLAELIHRGKTDGQEDTTDTDTAIGPEQVEGERQEGTQTAAPEPEQEVTTSPRDLFDEDTTQAQARADAEREIDEKLGKGQEQVPAESAGDLFDPNREKQIDITDIDTAAQEAATSPENKLPEPTQEQKEAGNYKKGHIKLHGLDISIENPRGSVRKSKPDAVKKWETTMQDHYGYIKGTRGADDEGGAIPEQVDAYIGQNPLSENIFIVDQVNPGNGQFDEHKVMMGYNDEAAAREGYLRNYEKNWKGLGQITRVPVDEFKTWLNEGDTGAPYDSSVPSKKPTESTTSEEIGEAGENRRTETPETARDVNQGGVRNAGKLIIPGFTREESDQIRERAKKYPQDKLVKSWGRTRFPGKPDKIKSLQDALSSLYKDSKQTAPHLSNIVKKEQPSEYRILVQDEDVTIQSRNLTTGRWDNSSVNPPANTTAIEYAKKIIESRGITDYQIVNKEYDPKTKSYKKVTEKGAALFSLEDAPAQVNTKEFKEWFGDSKVVDEDGEPLVAYHGTDEDFSEFKIGDVGFHVGTAEQAEDRSGRAELESVSLMPLYAHIEHPLRTEDARNWDYPNEAFDAIRNGLMDRYGAHETPYGFIEKFESKAENADAGDRVLREMMNWLKKRGFDGIVYQNLAEGKEPADSWIAFAPEQIKSATGNRGTFDSGDPDITHSLYSDETTQYSKDQAEAAISDSLKAINDNVGVEVEVIHSDNIPAEVKASIPQGKRAKGFFHDGKVYLVHNHISNDKGAIVTFAHEVKGHFGVERIMGDQWGEVMEGFDRLQAQQDKMPGNFKDKQFQKIMDQVNHRYSKADRATRVKEFIAIAAEQRESEGMVGRFMRMVRELFRKALRAFGVTRMFTMADVDIVLSRSEEFLRTGEEEIVAEGAAIPAFSVDDNDKTGKDGLQSEDGQDKRDTDSGRARPEKDEGKWTSLSGSPVRPDWSENTRIRNKRGPARIFRGAERPTSVEDFSSKSLGKNTGSPTAGLGVFFTMDPAEAGQYGHVEEFRLDLRNPKYFKRDNLPQFYTTEDASNFSESLKAKGHDGIIIDHTDVGFGYNIIAFSPDHVISVPRKPISFSLEDDPTESGVSSFEAENRRIREKDITLWDKSKKLLRRQFAPGGLLPNEVFDIKIDRDSNFEVVEFDVRHLVGEMERAIKQDYGKRIQELSQNDMDALSQALGGQLSGKVKNNTKIVLVAMRQYIDKQSQEYRSILFDQAREFIEKAEATGDNRLIEEANQRAALMEVIASNEGKYVHRSYQAFDDRSWFKKVPNAVLNDARKYFVERYKESGESISEARRLTEVTLNEILKTGTAYDSMESFIKETKLGAKDLSILKRRKEVPAEIRALLGEYKDPRLNFAKTSTKMGRLIWNQRFLDKVQEIGMGQFLFEGRDRPPDATRQIATDGSEVFAPLNGLWTYPEIDQAFTDALGKEKMANWYRIIVQLNGIVKFGKTVLSPTTAARNWQSAMLFTIANGHFDLTHVSKSISGLREYFQHRGEGAKLQYLRRLKELGVVYDTPFAGEMMRLLDDSNIENMITGSMPSMVAKNALHYAQRFYQYGDDFWKIIGFENEKQLLMKHTKMSEQEAEVEAAERIRNTYPTYSMVGRAMQSLRRIPLIGTFVSFPAEIIRTSVNMVKYLAKDLQTPGMRPIAMRRAAGLAIVSGFAYALQEASKVMLDIDDDDEEAIRLQAAPWQENSNLIFTGRDEQGNLRYIDISFVDPYNYWKRPINAVIRDEPWQDKMVDVLRETLSPFLGTDIAAGAIFEVLSNKRLDSGTEVYKEHDLPHRQLIDMAQHLRKNLQPGIASNVERTWKALDGETSPSGKKYNMDDEMWAWAGWRMSTLDPKVALYYRAYDFKDAKADSTRTLTEVLNSPNDVSDSDIQAAYIRSLKIRQDAYEDMFKLVGAARQSGLIESDIIRILKSNNVSNQDIGSLLRRVIPPWQPSSVSERNAIRRAEALYDDESRQKIRERYQKARSIR